MNDLIHITRELMNIRSVSSDISEVNKCMDLALDYLRASNVSTVVYESNGKKSLFASLRKGVTSPDILMDGHIDVVPAALESDYVFRKEKDRIYGRGSYDMKGAVAVQIHLMQHFAQSATMPNLGLIITPDEEIGGRDGAKYLADQGIGINTQMFFTGEPFRDAATHAAKGRATLTYAGTLEEIANFHRHLQSAFSTKLAETGSTLASTKLYKVDTNISSASNVIPKRLVVELVPTNYKTLDLIIHSKTDIIREGNNLIIQGSGGHSHSPSETHNPIEAFLDTYINISSYFENVKYILVADLRFTRSFVEQHESDFRNLLDQKNASYNPMAKCRGSDDFLAHPSVVLLKEVYLEVTGNTLSFKVANGSSDLKWFDHLGRPGISLGIKGGNAHMSGEFIDIASQRTMYDVMQKYIAKSHGQFT